MYKLVVLALAVASVSALPDSLLKSQVVSTGALPATSGYVASSPALSSYGYTAGAYPQYAQYAQYPQIAGYSQYPAGYSQIPYSAGYQYGAMPLTGYQQVGAMPLTGYQQVGAMPYAAHPYSGQYYQQYQKPASTYML